MTRLHGVNLRALMLVGASAVAVGVALLMGQSASAAPTVGNCQAAAAPSVDWHGCVLSGAALKGAKLSSAKLGGADLSSAVLTGADLSGATLSGANLTSATLTRADLSGALMVKARFKSATMLGTNLSNAVATTAGFTDANLTNANLRDADFTGALLTGAILKGAKLNGSQVMGWITAGFSMAGVDLSGQLIVTNFPTDFKLMPNLRPDFRGANLSNATADYWLAGADFTDANLANANFVSVDLAGANFANADVSGTDFKGAYLQGANFVGAKITDAKKFYLACNSQTRFGSNGLDLSDVHNRPWYWMVEFSPSPATTAYEKERMKTVFGDADFSWLKARAQSCFEEKPIAPLAVAEGIAFSVNR